MSKQKDTVTFVGRHGIKYERFPNDPLLSCRFVINTVNPDASGFGFGDVFHYNADLDLFTIITDRGEVIQRQSDFVTIAGDGKVNK